MKEEWAERSGWNNWRR